MHVWPLLPRRSSFTGFTPRGLPIISEVTGLASHALQLGQTYKVGDLVRYPKYGLLRAVAQHTSTE